MPKSSFSFPIDFYRKFGKTFPSSLRYVSLIVLQVAMKAQVQHGPSNANIFPFNVSSFVVLFYSRYHNRIHRLLVCHIQCKQMKIKHFYRNQLLLSFLKIKTKILGKTVVHVAGNHLACLRYSISNVFYGYRHFDRHHLFAE